MGDSLPVAEASAAVSLPAGSSVAAGPIALEGRMGTWQVVLTVLAMSGPLGAVAGVLPLVIDEGNGAGGPGTYAVMGVILLLFAVGFTTMARHFPRTGAFYAYITGGLGKPLGLGAAYVAQLGYLTLLVGTYAFFADQLNVLLKSMLGTANVPWWVWASALWVLITALGHFNVEMSGWVLSVMMLLEVAIVLVFDVPMIWTGGPHGWQFYSFTPHAFVSGPVGLAILFASATFMGFEGTAIYRSEVKNPNKTIPRATYLAISLIGAFYVLTAWALVTFYGVDHIKAAAASNPSGLFADGMSYYAGPIVAQGMLCLVCTSLFAATLSAHNPMARYTFALARDGIYPSVLARVHPKHRSPAIASAVTSIIAAAIQVPFVVIGINPVTFYSWMFAIGTYALLLCMALTCLSVIVYFWQAQRGEGLWNIIIAPGMGLIGLGVVLGISSYYFPLLINNDKVLALVFQSMIAALLILGVVLALIWRRTRPSVYARIGGEYDAGGT